MFRFILFALWKCLIVQEKYIDRYRWKIQKKANAAMLLKFGSTVLILCVPSWPDRLKGNFLKEQENYFIFLFIFLVPLLFLQYSQRGIWIKSSFTQRDWNSGKYSDHWAFILKCGTILLFDLLRKATMLALFSKFHST